MINSTLLNISSDYCIFHCPYMTLAPSDIVVGIRVNLNLKYNTHYIIKI